MNLNDYKDGNGNVEVSETLVSDLIGGINEQDVISETLTPQGSWTSAGGGFGPLKVRRQGNTVALSGIASGGGVGTNIVILPSIFRPVESIRFLVASSSTTDNTAIQVNPNGGVVLQFGSTSNVSLANCVWITD